MENRFDFFQKEEGVVEFVSQETLENGSFGEYNKKLFKLYHALNNCMVTCIFCKSPMEWVADEYRCAKCNSYSYEGDKLCLIGFNYFGVTHSLDGDRYSYQVSWYDHIARLFNVHWNSPIKEWKISSFDDIIKFKKEADELMLFV